jgi:uncharacterized protein
MLIALEEHWIAPGVTSALKAQARPDESLAFNEMGDHRQRLEDLGEGRLAAMDAQGIDISILALTPPGTQPLSPEHARRLSSAANDTAIAAVSKYPTRLRALSTLPMSSPKHVVDELVRAKSLGHVGTMVYGRSGDRFLDDPAYDEFFAAAAELGQPVFIHPQIPSDAARDSSYRGFGDLTDLSLATFGWGWHLDAALAALRLIIRGTFDRHPDLQIVLGHWGEMLLFWLDRADSLSRVAGLQRSVSEYIRTNFHITASGMLNPALLHHVLSVTTIDRLMFSTDYPFQQPKQDEITSFLGHFATDEDRQKFSFANAASLYRLDIVGLPHPGVEPVTTLNETINATGTAITAPRNGSPTRALVLGGGGAVGVGWQSGLLTGLREAGVDLAGAESIVGTSAGAFVGALLSSGREVTEALASLAALGQGIDPDSLAAGDEAFLRAVRLASLDTDSRRALRAIGRAAQEASTPAEDVYLGLFGALDSTAWPAGFRCTAIETDSGELVVWDEGSGVSLLHAVAASCAVPILFPTVTINGHRYMDGGILSHLNATAAPLTDVLVVLSCHPLGSQGGGGGGSLAASVTPDAELAPLRQTRRLVAVEPDFSDIEVPANMMDPNLAIQAFQIGKRQVAAEAVTIRAAWNS